MELLSPAGNRGADAVYLGYTAFGARSYACNFDDQQLKEAVEYAHERGRKIYVTVNTLVKQCEVDDLCDVLELLVRTGVDAAIVQDLGVVRIARERGRVRVTVEDDGAGFAPQQLPHAFDGQSSVKEGDHPDGRRNMGIGLSACRAILHAHGGDIQAYNRKSGGAGVSFWLPDEEDAYGE